MQKVNVLELKVNDYVELFQKKITGWTDELKIATRGFVTHTGHYSISNKDYRVIQTSSDFGLKTFYLDLTDEVLKIVLSDEEKAELKLREQLVNLKRTVSNQGSDPEIFVVDKNNVVIPSFLFLKGKDSPNRIPQNNEPLFWDGFQAEFNTPGDSCLDRTVYNIRFGLMALNQAAKKYNPDARLTISPTLDIPPHLLTDGKEEHVQFGCMPSKNVYGMKGIVADGREVPFRSAGGHIHLQLTPTQKNRIPEYVKALDAILGVACVSMFGNFDDPRRREYYGLAGEYRTPSHGMEYRPLSNVWMCHPTTTYIVFELARKVISLVDAGLFEKWRADESDVIECINTCNIPLACAIIHENEEMFKHILKSFCYKSDENTTVVYNMFTNGLHEFIDDADNVTENWGLDNVNFSTYSHRIANLKDKPNFKKLLTK